MQIRKQKKYIIRRSNSEPKIENIINFDKLYEKIPPKEQTETFYDIPPLSPQEIVKKKQTIIADH